MTNGRIRISVKSKNFRWMLAFHGRTLTWFAQRMGVSRQYVNQLVVHKRNPGPLTREKMLRVFRRMDRAAKWETIFEADE